MNSTRILAVSGKVFLTALLIGAFTSGVLANPKIKEDKADKVTLKTRDAVSKASPDDWFTLAEAAEKCIRKGVNLQEASQWLDQSIEIRETMYNLMVKGDYYAANRLPQKAMEYYVKSINAGKAEDPAFNPEVVQKKIAAILFK